ncbi:MAG: hypothetical protein IPJ98_09455 [Bryobacterales bacterium]|nr:hypothetical protein [Bryobacterales bacterium]
MPFAPPRRPPQTHHHRSQSDRHLRRLQLPLDLPQAPHLRTRPLRHRLGFNHYQTHAVIAALQHHLIPWLIGKDASQIEDLWQSSHLRTYWRNGPVNNNVLSALDMALWDIKGKARQHARL